MRIISAAVIFLLLFVCVAQFEASGKQVSAVADASYFTEQQKMIYLRTVITKLKETAKAMKDISELEAMGMPVSEINRLQGAMKIKLEQLTDEALVLIRTL